MSSRIFRITTLKFLSLCVCVSRLSPQLSFSTFPTVSSYSLLLVSIKAFPILRVLSALNPTIIAVDLMLDHRISLHLQCLVDLQYDFHCRSPRITYISQQYEENFLLNPQVERKNLRDHYIYACMYECIYVCMYVIMKYVRMFPHNEILGHYL